VKVLIVTQFHSVLLRRMRRGRTGAIDSIILPSVRRCDADSGA